MAMKDNGEPLERLSRLLSDDMAAVNALIRERMVSRHAPLIPEVTAHLVEAGGKRLRPLLTVAAARLCGYQGTRHHLLAATVEFIHTGDLSRLPPGVAATSVDHVIANPPFFATGTRAPDAYRAGARHEETPLADWIDTGLRRLRPRGWLTVIHRAERLGDLLDALSGRAGDVAILPVAPRAGAAAGRVIVAARKGARGPLRLLAPFVMHANARHLHDGEDLTPEAQAVLRGGAALDLKPPERR